MKKVLIFGMEGFVGRYLADEFRKCGYDVYASSRYGGKLEGNYEEVFFCDILDSDRVKTVISEVDPTHIVNLAGISSVGISWRIPQATMQTNVCGTLNILDAVIQCDIDAKVLLIGSSEEYAPSSKPIREDSELDANNPYGISKLAEERLAKGYSKRYGMNVYFVRSFNHTGIGQSDSFVIPSWCRQAAAISVSGGPGEMYVGNLDITRDFSNVKDVVRAYRLILEKGRPGVSYNVGSGEGVPLRKILDYITSLSSEPIEVKTEERLLRPIENPVICCDRSLITEELGWKPEYNIFMTAKEMFDYYERREKERTVR